MKLPFWIPILILALPRLVMSAVDANSPVAQGTQRRVVGIDPTFGNLYHETFEAMRHDRYAETIAKATSALAMKPDGKNAAPLLICRAVAYSSLRDVARALADLTEAIRRDPLLWKLVVPIAACFWPTKAITRKRIADLTHAGPEPLGIGEHVALARAYLETGRKDRARVEYRRAMQLPVKEDSEYVSRARAYCATGQYKAAASDLAAAKRRRPSDRVALNAAAWFAATCPDGALRDGKAAILDASRACLGTKWKDADLIDTLAAAYAETGDCTRAIQYARQAVSLGGGFSRGKRGLERHLHLFEENKPVREGGELK